MSVPHIRFELQDSYAITLSHDALMQYIERYQVMLGARQQAPLERFTFGLDTIHTT